MESAPRLSRPRRIAFTLLLGAGLAALATGLLELGAGWYFAAADHPFSQARIFFTENRLLDPLLGWARNPPFVDYREGGPGKELSIVALGGSTTDPEGSPRNWAGDLAGLCAREGRPCLARNGGVSGYNSTQELLKLARDVVPLRPGIVISLSGVNELMHFEVEGNTFGTMQAQERMNALLSVMSEVRSREHLAARGAWLPSLRRLVAAARARLGPPRFRAHYGYPDNFSRAQRWETNARMMQAISAAFGARFLVVLQPHAGLELEALQRLTEVLPLRGKEYDAAAEHREITGFYREMREACRRMSFCLDLSAALAGPERRVRFADTVHLDQEGHRIEAGLIHAELVRRGWM